jgi:hypothetical protein
LALGGFRKVESAAIRPAEDGHIGIKIDQMPVFLQIPPNPNCEAMDGQVFQCRTAARAVTHVRSEYGGHLEWCPVTGIDEGGTTCAATACLVEDSGDGACYLVAGGEWGLRLQPPGATDGWDLTNPRQWGVPYFLLAGQGDTLRFAP